MAKEGCVDCANWVARDLQTHLSAVVFQLLEEMFEHDSSGEITAVMQPAESWHRSNFAAKYKA